MGLTTDTLCAIAVLILAGVVVCFGFGAVFGYVVGPSIVARLRHFLSPH